MQRRSGRALVWAWGLGLALGFANVAIGEPRPVPDEFESVGGHALGLSHGGTAALSGLASVRANPAMLALERKYLLSAAYHWPSVGSEFYQGGIVDSKTAQIAAGVSYTGTQTAAGDKQRTLSPVNSRVALALAQAFERVAVGVSGQMVRHHTLKGEHRGHTLGLGIAGLVTPQLRMAFSVENLANGSVREVAPRTMRAGGAYTLGPVTAHLDVIQRQRVALEDPVPTMIDVANNAPVTPREGEERMAIGSFTVRVQNLLRIMGGYGVSLGGSGPVRQSIGGGVAVVSQKFVLSYLVQRPYLSSPVAHQAVNLGIHITL